MSKISIDCKKSGPPSTSSLSLWACRLQGQTTDGRTSVDHGLADVAICSEKSESCLFLSCSQTANCLKSIETGLSRKPSCGEKGVQSCKLVAARLRSPLKRSGAKLSLLKGRGNGRCTIMVSGKCRPLCRRVTSTHLVRQPGKDHQSCKSPRTPAKLRNRTHSSQALNNNMQVGEVGPFSGQTRSSSGKTVGVDL